MNVHALTIIALALFLSACGKQEPAEPEQSATDGAAAAVEDAAGNGHMFDQAFIDHMHAHAEQLDELMFALADDDLQAALTPAYWLSRHESVSGVPEDWQPYIEGMRAAAREVEVATDVETARIAAERISDQCQYCHDAAGINALGGE